MPVYQHQCNRCEHVFDVVRGMRERVAARCPKCGAGSQQLISVGAQVGGFAVRDMTFNTDGTTVRVNSKDDVVRECRKRDLVHMGYMHFDKEE